MMTITFSANKKKLPPGLDASFASALAQFFNQSEPNLRSSFPESDDSQ